jgi:plastocyanin
MLKSRSSRMLFLLVPAMLLILFSAPAYADTVDVAIESFLFTPDSVNIPSGTTVRWTNLDGVPHTSTSDAGVWDSGNMNNSDQFTFTFDSAGTFPYHCDIHPNMTAQIIVHRASVPSMTPYGFGILILLLIVSALWMWRRKRVVAPEN